MLCTCANAEPSTRAVLLLRNCQGSLLENMEVGRSLLTTRWWLYARQLAVTDSTRA